GLFPVPHHRVRAEPPQRRREVAVRRQLADDRDIGLLGEERRQPGPRKPILGHHEHPDGLGTLGDQIIDNVSDRNRRYRGEVKGEHLTRRRRRPSAPIGQPSNDRNISRHQCTPRYRTIIGNAGGPYAMPDRRHAAAPPGRRQQPGPSTPRRPPGTTRPPGRAYSPRRRPLRAGPQMCTYSRSPAYRPRGGGHLHDRPGPEGGQGRTPGRSRRTPRASRPPAPAPNPRPPGTRPGRRAWPPRSPGTARPARPPSAKRARQPVRRATGPRSRPSGPRRSGPSARSRAGIPG